jgi:O-antigen ligase
VQGLLHFPAQVNFVYLVLLSLAWVGIECYVGGTRLLYSLPAYGVIAICSVLTLVSIRVKRTPPNPYCVGSTLLMGAWVLYRSSHSPIEYLALPDFFMMIGCLMVYLITVFYLTDAREQMSLVAVLWAIAAVEVWVGVVQFAKDPNYMFFGLLRPQTIRPSGMYISPNNFAGFLAAVSVISLSLGVWGRWPVWARILSLYITLVSMLGVAISGSRGGYFDVIGCLVFFTVGTIYAVRLVNPRLLIPVAVGASVGAVVVVGVAALLMFHSAFLTHRMQTMVAKDIRIYNWEAALDHIRQSPWVGTGAGTHLIFGRLFRRPEVQADPVHAHCDYLELMAEYGLVGVVCMALFLAAHTTRGLRSFSQILRQRVMPSGMHTSNSFAMQFGALCAVGGLAIHSVVDFDMHIPGNALIFAFLFGVLAQSGTDQPAGLVDRRFTPLAKFVAPVLGLFMLWRGMPLLPSEYCSEWARIDLRTGKYQESTEYAERGIGAAANPVKPRESIQPAPGLDWWLAKMGANPKNEDLYFYLGEANRALGTRMMNPYLRRLYFRDAASAFEAGLKVFPQDESMLVRYGQVLDGLRRYAEAEVIYQRALKWDPNLGSLYDYYGKHLIAEGKKVEADALAHDRSLNKTEAVDAGSKFDLRLQ